MLIQQTGYAAMKGSRHVRRETVRLSGAGVAGDRRLCLVDPVRQVVTRTVRHPRLLQAVVDVVDGELSVELDGRTVRAEPQPTGRRIEVDYWGRPTSVELLDGPWSAVFSAHLGREVVVARTDPGAVVYGAAVSLVTTAAGRSLEERLGTAVDPARFRATFVVDTDDHDFEVEDGWPGRRLQLGHAVVEVCGPIARCAVVDLDPVTGQPDLRVLEALAGYRRQSGEIAYGVDAVVVRPAIVRSGDRVSLVSD